MARPDPEVRAADHFDGMDFFLDQAIKYANELPEELHFLEVGTYLGGTACALMQAIRQSKKPDRLLITVDPYGSMPFRLGPVDVQQEADYNDSVYRAAIAEMALYAQNHELNHIHYKLTSDDFMKIWSQVDHWLAGGVVGKQFGFAFLDGAHNFEVVTREVEWLKQRMPEGMMVLDDITYVDMGKNGASGGETIAEMRRTAMTEDNFRLYWPIGGHKRG